MSPLMALLRRGLIAGGVAGALSGTFSFLVAEPVIDQAIRLESSGHPGEHEAEVFTRSTQHLGLVAGSVAAGLAFGVIFAVVYAALHRRDPLADGWNRSLRLAAAAFAALWLLPFLRYPGNPPGVGDPGTIDQRTAAWLGAIGISVVVVATTWRGVGWLAARGVLPAARQLAAAALLAAGLSTLFLLPDNPDVVAVGATLLWDFRLLGAAAAVLLWGGLGAVFGLLSLRAAAVT